MIISAQTPELIVNVDCREYLLQIAPRIDASSLVGVLREA